MATWGEFEAEQPALAANVRERFDVRKHKTLATLRADGSPRISGIEVEFADGEMYLGMMPDSHKLNDLRRDPRLAVHSPTVDPPEGAEADWPGEAKIAGRAVEVGFPDAPVEGAGRFGIDISEVAFTHLNDAGDRLVVESWHPSRGLRSIERT
jgi:hypothetical protein